MESDDKEKKRAQTKKELMKRKKVKILPEIKKLTDAKGKPLSKLEQYQMQWFIDELRSKFGIAVHFQKDKNDIVRGYGIVDHNNKVALNGSEVMKLADIIGIMEWKAAQEAKATRKKTKHADKTEGTKPSFNNRSQSSASKENEMPKETVKATIYCPDSTLDIYRPMFKARACSVNGKNIVRMDLDGKTYDHAITDNQTEWYCKAPTEAHDDIAIRLAVFYFYKEIYESYRRLLADAYVKEGGQALELPEGSVRCYKRMNGLWLSKATAAPFITTSRSRKAG